MCDDIDLVIEQEKEERDGSGTAERVPLRAPPPIRPKNPLEPEPPPPKRVIILDL